MATPRGRASLAHFPAAFLTERRRRRRRRPSAVLRSQDPNDDEERWVTSKTKIAESYLGVLPSPPAKLPALRHMRRNSNGLKVGWPPALPFAKCRV